MLRALLRDTRPLERVGLAACVVLIALMLLTPAPPGPAAPAGAASGAASGLPGVLPLAAVSELRAAHAALLVRVARHGTLAGVTTTDLLDRPSAGFTVTVTGPMDAVLRTRTADGRTCTLDTRAAQGNPVCE